MVFLAADESDETIDQSTAAEESSEMATEESGGSASQGRAAQKVDLDLDDAPFLEDEDEEEELPEEEPEDIPSLGESPQKKKSKTMLFVFIGIGVIILLLSAIAVKVFIFDSPEEKPAPPPQEAPLEEETPPPPPVEKQAPPPPPEEPGITLIRMKPFWIDHKDKKGAIRFLVARFSLTTTDELVVAEYARKKVTIRDAVYYYMKNKDLNFLSDKKNGEALKKDLLMVINQYIAAGQFDEILFEEYLVR
ncbi:flagellar basal body-associated FliL family protein [Maridesulfovibrio bastinii]|uniref:flagellar basal body-associated FliL family protein n=1 Tax=Maridesulfovibrio bastinii TaxID=47157 RepID=UPI00042078D9|nr:flagellar basal body-associated FliL family protein [Maridesulfovibrio bastinii]